MKERLVKTAYCGLALVCLFWPPVYGAGGQSSCASYFQSAQAEDDGFEGEYLNYSAAKKALAGLGVTSPAEYIELAQANPDLGLPPLPRRHYGEEFEGWQIMASQAQLTI